MHASTGGYVLDPRIERESEPLMWLGLCELRLKRVTDCGKINIGALGNIVPQLHVHIVARNEGDPGWPGPVWGLGPRKAYRREDLHQFVAQVRSALSP
jgi:diadenosine tetraphosphate (Ap4A) HIT family hydrolase